MLNSKGPRQKLWKITLNRMFGSKRCWNVLMVNARNTFTFNKHKNNIKRDEDEENDPTHVYADVVRIKMYH